MQTPDTLTNALLYALDHAQITAQPIAAVNCSGYEAEHMTRQSYDACQKVPDTLEGVFNTVLVRATRQVDETLGLVAMAARHAAPEAIIVIAQENIHGATGLERHLRQACPDATTVIKYKCRTLICRADAMDAALLEKWQQGAAIRKMPASAESPGGYWSAPGVFSWDRADMGSRLLLSHLPEKLGPVVADLGCGNGYLSLAVARQVSVAHLYAIDANAIAVECCRRNLADRGFASKSTILWRDATLPQPDLPPIDTVITNPPFHTQQEEDRVLGQKFCTAALKMLRTGGTLYLVANRHLPYESILDSQSAKVTLLADRDGFKVIRAAK